MMVSFVGSKLGLLSVKNFLLFGICILFSYSSVTLFFVCPPVFAYQHIDCLLLK